MMVLTTIATVKRTSPSMNGHIKKITVGLLLSSAATLTAMDAFATEGYFTHGAGARNKALAGAGVADGRDATALITNPAGMVGNGTELTVSVSLHLGC